MTPATHLDLARAWIRLASWAAGLTVVLAASVSAQQINEIRIDHPGDDSDEYFELIGTPSASLAGFTYLVVGDSGSIATCGVIEGVVGLSSFSLQADGLLCLRNVNSLGTPQLTGYDGAVSFGGNTLENSDNVTHMLVTGFTGALGQDLDTNNDGTLDVTPWTSVVDCVALSEGTVPNCTTDEYLYCATVVGPDGSFVPGHVYRYQGTLAWAIGTFSPLGATDTPGAPNPAPSTVPDIQDEYRDPCVPLTSQSATAGVKVRLATSATLYWKVNGGSETSVAMSVAMTAGDTTWYEAAIPGQSTHGDLVEYYVVTTNANGNDQGFDQGYFVGTTPIADLRVNDPDGQNLYRFYGARVRGNVTLEPGVFSTTNMDFYVQDGTGGINVFQFGPHPEQPQLGDDVTVTSSLIQFNGKLEISPSGNCEELDILIHGSGSVPAPLRVNSCTPPESYEGLLVKTFHLQVNTGGDANWASNRNYRGANCTPEDSVTIFIDADTNIDGTAITSTYVDVVGIGGQFDSSFPYTSGYQIQPRGLADITYLNPLAVEDRPAASGLWLGPVSPNPIGRSAEVQYRIPGSAAEAVRVRLQVVDLQGRLVATLFDGEQAPGQHRVRLDRQRLAGAAGAVHFLRLEVDGQSVARKLVYR